jgi:hypothetical protein
MAYIVAFGYLSSVSILTAYLGLLWHKVEIKWKRNPRIIVAFIYILNSLFMHYVLTMPYLLVLFFSIFMLGTIFFGTKF